MGKDYSTPHYDSTRDGYNSDDSYDDTHNQGHSNGGGGGDDRDPNRRKKTDPKPAKKPKKKAKKPGEGWGVTGVKAKRSYLYQPAHSEEELEDDYVDGPSREAALIRATMSQMSAGVSQTRPDYQMAKSIIREHTSEFTEFMQCMANSWGTSAEKIWRKFRTKFLTDIPFMPEQVFLARMLQFIDEGKVDEARKLNYFLCQLFNLRMVYQPPDTIRIVNSALREALKPGADYQLLLTSYKSRCNTVRMRFESGSASGGLSPQKKVTSYCRFWNLGKHCSYGDKCRAMHACFLCGRKNHPVIKCFKIKNNRRQPRGNGNDQPENRGPGNRRGQ